MKNLCLITLLLVAFQSNALTYNSPTPKLHSVLDKKEAPALPGPVLTPPKAANRINTPGADRREVGIGLTIVGAIVLAAGAGIYLWAEADVQRQKSNGVRSFNGIYFLAGMLVGAIGVILMAVGLPIWLFNIGK
jgi:hypothetical protein